MADKTTKVITQWSESGLGNVTRKTYSYNAALQKTKTTSTTLYKNMETGKKSMRETTTTFHKGAKAANKFGGQVGGLALRFVGYQFILSQVMGMQQKVIQFVTESIEKYREYNKAIAEVSTILTRDNLPAIYGITAGIETLSKTYGKGATDLARGAYDILSAAFDSTDAIRLLNIATKAGIAGLADVSTSVDIFTSVLNAYGMTVGQAQEISDIFFQTIRYGKLVFDDLANALGYITPIAAAAGVPFREIAAALSTVTRMGLHVDMASRGLALAIQNVINPTKQAGEAAKKYGVDMSALAIQIKGLHGFILDLNEAMNEHGTTILPEMIRNMRSLRVIMALTSEEGVAGFTRDLDLMAASAGATEEAMTKMLHAAQTEADIAEQSMEYLQRRIGEAWHDVDIWWKKAQLWWGTLFSGGDADASVKEVEDRIDSIEKTYVAMMKNASDAAGKLPLADILLGEEAAPISELIDFGSIEKYMQIEEKKRQLAQDQYDLYNKIEAAKGGAEIPEGLFHGEEYTEAVNAANQLKALEKEYKAGKATMEDYEAQQMALQYSFDYLSNGLDTLSQNINASKMNILQLQNAIKDLKYEVENVYTAISGDEFIGKLDWSATVFETTTNLDRLQQFTKMGQQYGSEFVDAYKELFGELPEGFEKAISSINKYSVAVKAAKKIQDEFKDKSNETTKAIRENNLEIMKLQLIGMSRRRGLTRTEEKMIKQLQIKNLKERIAATEETIEYEVEMEQYGIDKKKAAYESAKELIQEYFDRESFILWQLKDIRDDELADMNQNYSDKKALLEKYTGWYQEEQDKLASAQSAYLEILYAIDEAGLAEKYKALYGIDVIDEAKKSAMAYFKFIKNNGLKVSESYEIRPSEKQEAAPPLPDTPIGRDIGRRLGIPGFKRGTYDVPYDQMVSVHQHEKIIPAGESTKDTGGRPIIIERVNIVVKEIADIGDANKLGALLSIANETRILDKEGKTTYRVR